MPQETELKLTFPAAAADRVQAALARAAPTVEDLGAVDLLSVYYDTPDHLLRRRGYALRLRREEGRWYQTLKGAGEVQEGLHRREEWEWPVPEGRIRPERVAEPPLRDLLAAALRGGLAPVFRTVFRRRRWRLRFPDGLEVEAALDLGEILAGERREGVAEVELELKEGDPARLRDLAAALRRDLPLAPCDRSKARRGYELAGS